MPLKGAADPTHASSCSQTNVPQKPTRKGRNEFWSYWKSSSPLPHPPEKAIKLRHSKKEHFELLTKNYVTVGQPHMAFICITTTT